MLRSILLATVLALAAPAAGQYGEIGFYVTSNGSSYGVRCPRTFTCTYLAGDLWRGMPADFVVRGQYLLPFAIAVSFDQPHQCLSVPGFHNQAMTSQFVVLLAGTLAQRDGIVSCPGGLSFTTLPIPPSLPVGAVLTMQALAHVNTVTGIVPGFSMALRMTVR